MGEYKGRLHRRASSDSMILETSNIERGEVRACSRRLLRVRGSFECGELFLGLLA
jgi:hypothetical protein